MRLGSNPFENTIGSAEVQRFRSLARQMDALEGRTGRALFGAEAGYNAPTVTPGASLTVNYSVAGVTPEGLPYHEVSVTATAAASNWFEFAYGFSPAVAANSASITFSASNLPNLSSFVYTFGDSGSYTKYIQHTRAIGVSDAYSSFRNQGIMTYNWDSTDWSARVGSPGNLSEIGWGVTKFRLTVANGQTCVFRLYDWRTGVSNRKGRLIFTMDDGVISQKNVLIPILEDYGIPVSLGIIPSQIGSSLGYMKLSDLRALVRKGHECLAHGPFGGIGSLFTTWGSTTERIKDIKDSRDYCKFNDLCNENGEEAYIFPQGIWNSGAGEVTLLDAMRQEGFTLGRAAGQTSLLQNISAIPFYSHAKFTLPVIGHYYAGAANTVNDATETANIFGTISDRIQKVIAGRADGIIMLHVGVASGAASLETHIERDRLQALCAMVAAEVGAGKAELALFSDLVNP